MTNIIDGKQISADIRKELLEEAMAFTKNVGTRPGLAVIFVGDDPASAVYVRNKGRACAEVGFYSEIHNMPYNTTQAALEAKIKELNKATDIHGILVQLPLPPHLDENAVIKLIDPLKDVDCFHPYNVGRLMAGDPVFMPCTPAGVMELLYRSGITVKGKRCTVIGRSNIVGKPMAMLLLGKSGTVTVCHSKTKDLASAAREADILVSAVGRAKFVTAEMVKEGAVIIDVGINRDASGKLCGDVDFDSIAPHCSHITPVPGGVGPMTITMLLKNTLTAAKLQVRKA